MVKRSSSSATPSPKRVKKTTPSLPIPLLPRTSVRRGTERKFVDVTSAYSTTTAGQIVLVNGIATGTDFTNRVGREITIKSLYGRCTFADATQINMVRLMYVYDKQTNGVLPAITDILSNASVYSPNNLNNRDRFVTLYDKVMVTSPQGPEVVFDSVYRPMSTPTVYSGTAATIDTIATGAIYQIFIPVANIPANAFVSYTRIRFSDK